MAHKRKYDTAIRLKSQPPMLEADSTGASKYRRTDIPENITNVSGRSQGRRMMALRALDASDANRTKPIKPPIKIENSRPASDSTDTAASGAPPAASSTTSSSSSSSSSSSTSSAAIAESRPPSKIAQIAAASSASSTVVSQDVKAAVRATSHDQRGTFTADELDARIRVRTLIQENIQSLKSLEQKYYFFDDTSDHHHSNARHVLVLWMYDVSDAFKLEYSTVFLAVRYFDRLIGKYALKSRNLAAVAGSCVMLAAKYNERETNVPRIEEMCRKLIPAHSPATLIAWEAEVLKLLDYSLSEVTAYDFIGYARNFELVSLTQDRVVPAATPRGLAAIAAHLCKSVYFLLDLSIHNYQFSRYAPSVVGGAVLAAARAAVGIEPHWPDRFKDAIGLEERHIATCFRKLYEMYSDYRGQCDDETGSPSNSNGGAGAGSGGSNIGSASTSQPSQASNGSTRAPLVSGSPTALTPGASSTQSGSIRTVSTPFSPLTPSTPATDAAIAQNTNVCPSPVPFPTLSSQHSQPDSADTKTANAAATMQRSSSSSAHA
jgi:Cyclin, N-terminal domain/Cyclin, C-terminal domain